jgi:hypothetical protein
MELTGEDGRTSATITTDVALTGKVASMGRGVLQDVSGRLVQTFAPNLASMLEGAQAPAREVPARPTAQAPSHPGVAQEAPELTPASSAQGPRAEPERAEALDLAALGGAMAAERLRDPRALGAVLALVALVSFWLGRRSAR